jgi:hypothetical protein
LLKLDGVAEEAGEFQRALVAPEDPEVKVLQIAGL